MTTSKKSAFARAAAQATLNAMTRRHAATLRVLLMKHPAIKETFNKLPPAVRTQAWFNGPEYDNAVLIGLSLRELPSFKAPALQRVLAPFLTPEWEASTHDFAYDQPNRDYTFTQHIPLPPALQDAIERHPSARWLRAHLGDTHHIPSSVCVRVAVYAYVKADSPTCRVVVKGVTERVVREEVKEIVCA